MNIPAVYRIAPKLTESCEVIRRDTRYNGRETNFIKKKQFRIDPDINTIMGDIDR